MYLPETMEVQYMLCRLLGWSRAAPAAAAAEQPASTESPPQSTVVYVIDPGREPVMEGNIPQSSLRAVILPCIANLRPQKGAPQSVEELCARVRDTAEPLISAATAATEASCIMGRRSQAIEHHTTLPENSTDALKTAASTLAKAAHDTSCIAKPHFEEAVRNLHDCAAWAQDSLGRLQRIAEAMSGVDTEQFVTVMQPANTKEIEHFTSLNEQATATATRMQALLEAWTKSPQSSRVATQLDAECASVAGVCLIAGAPNPKAYSLPYAGYRGGTETITKFLEQHPYETPGEEDDSRATELLRSPEAPPPADDARSGGSRADATDGTPTGTPTRAHPKPGGKQKKKQTGS